MRRQAISHGRAAQARLVKQYDIDAVEGWLREIKAAQRPERKRGRPPGAKYDDTALLQAAAARWRQASRSPVWRSLLAAGGESVARRLLYRLDQWDADGCAARGIADFYAARCADRDDRARAEFAARLAARVGGTKPEAHAIMQAVEAEIHERVARGDEVRFRGFGVFYPMPDGQVGFRASRRLLKAAQEARAFQVRSLKKIRRIKFPDARRCRAPWMPPAA